MRFCYYEAHKVFQVHTRNTAGGYIIDDRDYTV